MENPLWYPLVVKASAGAADDQFAGEYSGLLAQAIACHRVDQHTSGHLTEFTHGLANNRQGRIRYRGPGMIVERDQRQIVGTTHPRLIQYQERSERK